MSTPTKDPEEVERESFAACLRLLASLTATRRAAIIRALAVYFEVKS